MRAYIRRLNTFKGCIATAYSYAKMQHRTDEQLREEITREVWQHKDYRRLTRAEREYLRGYTDARRENLWNNDLVWRLGPASGPLPENTDGWKIPACCQVATKMRATACQICSHDLRNAAGSLLGDLCRAPGSLFGGHFWKGTEIAYTPYHCTNAAVEGCSVVPVATGESHQA